MKQQDLVIQNTSIVLNTDEDGEWMKDSLTFLEPDIPELKIYQIINYLYDEGYILDRRIEFSIE